VPNKSAKVAPAKDERLVRGGDWEVEVGSSAIVVAVERIGAGAKAVITATGKGVVC
jgi:hypothetical protein